MTETRFGAAVRVHVRVITAIMLRDMRTRFGRTHWHYLVAIGWPLSHLLAIVLAFVVVNRALPLGNDSVIFISTGALPYILCLYPARLAAFTFMHGRTLLTFPIVQTVDVILAKVMLEALSACVVCIIYCLGLWAWGTDLMPQDPALALTGVYASIFFGIGLGVFTMALVAIMGMAAYVLFIVIMIALYLSSGVYMNMLAPSQEALYFLSFNPLHHLVNWIRLSYYDIHTPVELDRNYVLFLSAALFAAGLAGERVFRGKILS